MPPFSSRRLCDPAVVILTCELSYRAKDHLDTLLAEQFVTLDALSKPHTFIVDLTLASHTIEDGLYSIKMVADSVDEMLSHPNYLGTVYVTPHPLGQHLLRLMTRQLMGRQPSEVVATLEEALKCARRGQL